MSNIYSYLSIGSQYEPFAPSPLVSNNSKKSAEPVIVLVPPPSNSRKNANSLYKQSLENGNVNKYVTPYKHDPTVMNADLPLPPVGYNNAVTEIPVPPVRYQRPPMRIHPRIDELDELKGV